MNGRSVYLARLLGIYCLLIAVAMALHKSLIVATVAALVRDPPLLFVLGVLTLLGGLALVLGHNVWSEGPRALVVTLSGWIITAKGLLFLMLPSDLAPGLYLGVLRYEQNFYAYAAVSFLLGVYLTFAGAGRWR